MSGRPPLDTAHCYWDEKEPAPVIDSANRFIEFIQQGRPVFVKTTFSFFREVDTWKVEDVQIK